MAHNTLPRSISFVTAGLVSLLALTVACQGNPTSSTSARAEDAVPQASRFAPGEATVGSVWVHLRDGTGDASNGTHDLTVQASEPVTVGERVTYRGTLRADVDLGFGYH